MKIRHGLPPIAPSQIGMHHVRLNRAGANQGNLDREIGKGARLKTRDQILLRPALDLKHADRFAATDHVIDLAIVEMQ